MYDWCKHTLIPSLKTEFVIVMDEARFHKNKRIQKLLNRHSHRILWLPLLGIMMLGLSLSYSFQRLAYKYDDKKNTLIEYWLDNSVFGHKAMRGQDYYLINRFQTKLAFNSLTEDISGFITACSGFFAKSALSKKPR